MKCLEPLLPFIFLNWAELHSWYCFVQPVKFRRVNFIELPGDVVGWMLFKEFGNSFCVKLAAGKTMTFCILICCLEQFVGNWDCCFHTKSITGVILRVNLFYALISCVNISSYFQHNGPSWPTAPGMDRDSTADVLAVRLSKWLTVFYYFTSLFSKMSSTFCRESITDNT